jgi:lysophospholipase L1-like esterase
VSLREGLGRAVPDLDGTRVGPVNHGGLGAIGVRAQTVLAAIVVLVALVGGVLLWQRPWLGGPPVALIGDSIFDMSESALRGRLADDWDVRIDAVPGATTIDQLDAALELAARRPPADQVVIELGTNDVTSGTPLEQSRATLEEVVAAFPSARCIHLVTVTDVWRNDGVVAPWEVAATYNEMLRELAEGDPRITIVEWAAALREGDADPSGNARLDDPVHPSTAGEQVLATLVADALAACSEPEPTGS